MVIDGNQFLKRAQVIYKELKSQKYPNTRSLSKLCGCSRNTAQRTLYRLRDEYLVPLDYDESRKGYYLKDPNYPFANFLPPGRDELTALLLARCMVEALDAPDLVNQLKTLWNQFSINNSSVSRELEPLLKYFSYDLTTVGDLVDWGVLKWVTAAAAGESVRLTYRSPWRHTQDKIYEGQILNVRFSDGALYLRFLDSEGHARILNASFIKSSEILKYDVKPPKNSSNPDLVKSENWFETFGVWSGENAEEIEIHIAAPASNYYSTQRWHEDQEDTWDGTTLIRKFPGIVSPELVRRALSLGRHVTKISPPTLKSLVAQELEVTLKNLAQ